jgi:hypothetical protein
MFAINRSLALKVNPNQAPITTDDIAIAANKAAINTRPVEAASTAASAEAKKSGKVIKWVSYPTP